MKHPSSRRPWKTRYLLAAMGSVACIMASAEAQAADYLSEWNDYSTGTHLWDTASAWNTSIWQTSPTPASWQPTTATVPLNASPNSFAASIYNTTTNNVVIETTGAVSVSRFSFGSADGAGKTTLKLGGNFTILGSNTFLGTATSAFSNRTAAAPEKLVIDLNSYTFENAGNTSFSNGIRQARNYTIKDSSTDGNGTFIIQNIDYDGVLATGRVNVENNVTVKVTDSNRAYLRGAGNSITEGWNFAPNATLWLTGTGTQALLVGGVFGNLTLGDSSNVNVTIFTPAINSTFKGNVVYNTTTSGSGSHLAIASGRTIYVGGNFTDKSAAGGTYGAGTVSFNGGGVTKQLVEINRNGLTSGFQIGQDLVTPGNLAGNVHLKDSLITTGTITVFGGSQLDIENHRAQAGALSIRNNAVLALTFGDDTEGALFKATGTLSLGTFSLDLKFDESSWTDGTNLLLFEYGTLSGTPNLLEVLNPDITYTALFNDGAGRIWLNGVTVIPEPSTVALALGGLTLLAYRQRRKAA